MALNTLGTNGTNTLSAFQMPGEASPVDTYNPSPTDWAALINSILDDVIGASTSTLGPIYPGAFSQNGLLFVPNRGVLKVKKGDWIGVDATGWPVLVSRSALANTTPGSSWTHN